MFSLCLLALSKFSGFLRKPSCEVQRNPKLALGVLVGESRGFTGFLCGPALNRRLVHGAAPPLPPMTAAETPVDPVEMKCRGTGVFHEINVASTHAVICTPFFSLETFLPFLTSAKHWTQCWERTYYM